MANVEKSNTMTCKPRAIRAEMSEEGFIWRSKVEGVTYW